MTNTILLFRKNSKPNSLRINVDAGLLSFAEIFI